MLEEGIRRGVCGGVCEGPPKEVAFKIKSEE